MSATVFAGSALVLYAAIAAALVLKYRRTHDAGFIWLGVAVLAWPLISDLAGWGERVYIDRIFRHEAVALWPFSLVERGTTTLGSLVSGLAEGQRLIGLILLLVAIGYLRRTNGRHAVIVGS